MHVQTDERQLKPEDECCLRPDWHAAAGGVVGGSYAAAWQASMGAIQSGGLFATVQSIAMGGVGGSTIALGGMTGGVAAAAALSTVCAAVDAAGASTGQAGEALAKAVAVWREQQSSAMADASAGAGWAARTAAASASAAAASASSAAASAASAVSAGAAQASAAVSEWAAALQKAAAARVARAPDVTHTPCSDGEKSTYHKT